MLRVRPTTNSVLAALLSAHPQVEFTDADPTSHATLEFSQDGWDRSVVVGEVPGGVFGLVEMMDNNPMVCADRVGVPPPDATLMLLALGPLFRAQLLTEPPVCIANLEGDESVREAFLREFTSAPEHLFHGEPVPGAPDDLVVATGMARMVDIRWSDLQELYSESFGRSFFVRQCRPDEEWAPELVLGSPYAYFRMSWIEELIKVQVMADRRGKGGEAQMVHAMNVMAGLEESLPFRG